MKHFLAGAMVTFILNTDAPMNLAAGHYNHHYVLLSAPTKLKESIITPLTFR